MTKPENFGILTGQNEISSYQFTKESLNFHLFCKNCGVRIATKGYVEEIGGHYVSVSIASIDNLTDTDRAEIPIQYMDGKNDNWFSNPAVTKHL